MSKKYVPNRLRGVLGGDDPSPSGKGSSSRGKGRKSRPWRVDAASWKQQLQERKAVFDNFALQEKAEEEKEATASREPETQEFEKIPLNVLTSTKADGGGRVEAMLTPKKGGQVETVFTSSTPSERKEEKNEFHDIDFAPSAHEESPTRSRSRSSSSPSPRKASPRRPSPLPRNRRTPRKGKKSPPRPELKSPKSVDSNDSQEYYIDVTDLASTKSEISNVPIIDGVAHDKEQKNRNRIFEHRTRVRLLRHGDSDDTAESIGFPGGEDVESSSDYPVDKSSMMEAVESFIDPGRKARPVDEITAPRSQIFARRDSGAEIISTTRRGGRRRNRTPPNPETPRAKKNSVRDNVTGDDEWSIRPVPSEEEIFPENQRSPLRPDADTATVSSGDSDIEDSVHPSTTRMSAQKEVDFDPNDLIADEEDEQNGMIRTERTAMSLSPVKRKGKKIVRSSSEHNIDHTEEEKPSTTGTTPDPLQRARKSLLMSNLNRSVRSLDTNHSRQDDYTVGDSSIESSYSASMFVPLRSHRRSNVGGKREIPLAVLDDHGVYVSKYDKNAIFVPPTNDQGQASTESPKNESAQDLFNQHGAYVPHDKAASTPDDILGDDNLPETKDSSAEIEKASENETITNLESKDADTDEVVDDQVEKLAENEIISNLESKDANEVVDDQLEKTVEDGQSITKLESKDANEVVDDQVEKLTENEIITDVESKDANEVVDDQVEKLVEDAQPITKLESKDADEVVDDQVEKLVEDAQPITKLESKDANEIVDDQTEKSITNIDSETANDEYAVDSMPAHDVQESSHESDVEELKTERKEQVEKSEDDAAVIQSEGTATLQEKPADEVLSPKNTNEREKFPGEDSPSVEQNPEDNANNVDQESESIAVTTQNQPHENCTSQTVQIDETTEDYDDVNEDSECAVDEIYGNRIRLVSDLKRYVSTIYIGNHVCVESIGTSEDPDPLDALRRKRAAVKNRVNMHLKAQLNDTVSALNTDHHHVIESPGKMVVSGKGKKWKERMAMKKLSKKSNVDTKSAAKSELQLTESVVDYSTTDDGSNIVQSQNDIDSSDPVIENETENEKAEDLKKADDIGHDREQDITNEMDYATGNESVAKTEEMVLDAPGTCSDTTDDTHGENLVQATKELEESVSATVQTSSVACDKMRQPPEESKAVDTLLSLSMPEDSSPVAQEMSSQKNDDSKSVPEKPIGINVSSTSETKVEDKEAIIAETTEVSQEPTATSTLSEPIARGDGISSATGVESQEIGIDLPVAVSDNNIIQGLPPNKGKKWKDRLKKKKNKKSEKNSTGAKDDVESGEGASESIEASTTDHTSQTVPVSTSDSHHEIPTDTNSKARPPFNRGISDLTTEEKQRGASPTNEPQADTSPKNVGKKSNKWKNRLAKMKGSKQESAKNIQADLQSDPHTTVKPEPKAETPDGGQTLSDLEVPDINLVTTTEPPPVQPEKPIPTPKTPDHLAKMEIHTPTEASTQPKPGANEMSNIETEIEKVKTQDPNIHKNLRQSFDVFDAFLKTGQTGQTNPIDDESIYTEMTIGQETLLQSGLQVASEEELSYMDFTYEESVQPSFAEQTAASKIPTEGKMMSPFMANLLSSRMFQDDGAPVPKMSLSPKDKLQNEKQSVVTDSPDMKKYPTITVGDAFDDEMTQITMGSLEDDHKDDHEEEFFDAESKPLSPKSLGKKSKRSTNSGKSKEALSKSSTLPCSEASKQRIVEILRKEVWSRDNNVVQNAMEELNSEAKNGYDHRAHIVRCGGVMTIMRAMEMNSDSEPVQIASCSTLEKLALEPQTQMTICEMEGISLIVRSMQVNVENVKLQEAACSALATICRQHEGNDGKDLMKDAEDAVPTVLSCMTRYQTNSCIQAKGFQAIANLCSGVHAQQRLQELSKAGGIMTLTMAIQTPWENKNDQQEAISNLSILLRGITELNETSALMSPTGAISNDSKQDGTSATGSQIKPSNSDESNGEVLTDNETVTSYMEEIPDMPMMSTMSMNGEDIPDLGQYPTMMSNVEWHNFGEDDLDAGRKVRENSMSPARAKQSRGDGTQNPGEEQCTIQ